MPKGAEGMPGVVRVATAADYLQAQRVRTRAIDHFRRALATCDVILTPATAVTAPIVPDNCEADGWSDLNTVTELMRFAMPGNLTGLPAIAFPVGYDPRGRSWNQPLPWPGGEWRLADVVSYQLAASAALLEHATAQREFWLRNALGVARRACQRDGAFVVPAGQRDPLATARLLEILELGGLELERAPAPFQAESREFAAGSHVIRLQQPASAAMASASTP